MTTINQSLNNTGMKQFLSVTLFATIFLAACGGSKKEGDAALNEKKSTLEKLKADKSKSDDEIKKLEEEIAKLDTTAVNSKAKLVSLSPVITQNFQHFIDLQGHVDAENISYITPRGMPGQVKAIYIKQGDMVKKGQLVLKMDDAILRQSISAVKKSLEVTKTQLSLAKNIFQRQKNLWDQNIGTEVQLLQAKANVEQLENGLKASEENVKTAQEQLNTTNVYSDVSGVADIVAVKVGEVFSGMNQIKIVNTSNLKVVTNVPENYGGRIRNGSAVTVSIPDLGKNINTSISLISQSVDATQRGFVAEAKLPYDGQLRPNQLAVVKILDYAAKNAVVIPINVVQTDEKGKYVYAATKLSNGKMVAQKKNIIIGEVYGDIVEVKSGLQAGDQIVTEGFQSLYEGQNITIK